MDNICLGCLETIEEQAGPDHLLPNLIQDPDPVEVLRWLRYRKHQFSSNFEPVSKDVMEWDLEDGPHIIPMATTNEVGDEYLSSHRLAC